MEFRGRLVVEDVRHLGLGEEFALKVDVDRAVGNHLEDGIGRDGRLGVDEVAQDPPGLKADLLLGGADLAGLGRNAVRRKVVVQQEQIAEDDPVVLF